MKEQNIQRIPATQMVSTNVIFRDQPNLREKIRDFTVEFLKCAKFHGKFTEGVHGKFTGITGPTAVISRCYMLMQTKKSVEQHI